MSNNTVMNMTDWEETDIAQWSSYTRLGKGSVGRWEVDHCYRMILLFLVDAACFCAAPWLK